jgi:hypothetical protein
MEGGAVSFNLYWAQNDGIGGHVWLSLADMLALRTEMLAQGMAWEEEPAGGIPAEKLLPRAEPSLIRTEEIEQALERASPEPLTLADGKLWQDWLAFLAGAAGRGGLLVRP